MMGLPKFSNMNETADALIKVNFMLMGRQLIIKLCLQCSKVCQCHEAPQIHRISHSYSAMKCSSLLGPKNAFMN